MQKIRVGTAGIGNGDSDLRKIAEVGLNAAEVEFVRQVYLKNDRAKQIGELAKKLDIRLSVHAPYYINLNSDKKQIVGASRSRIIQSCERAHYLGAKFVVFHPGYYGKRTKEETYENIKLQIEKIQDEIKEFKGVKLAPETMGKINVFGSSEEIFKLVKETKCAFCFDFAHMKARNLGKTDYDGWVKGLKKFKDITAHMSGIAYGMKGERHHELTPTKELDELTKSILKHKVNITIINESPNPLKDSLKMKEIFEKRGYKFK